MYEVEPVDQRVLNVFVYGLAEAIVPCPCPCPATGPICSYSDENRLTSSLDMGELSSYGDCMGKDAGLRYRNGSKVVRAPARRHPPTLGAGKPQTIKSRSNGKGGIFSA